MPPRTLLLSPPGFSGALGSPYLAMPLLAAVLQQAGQPCDYVDLNVDFFRHFVALERMQQSLADVLQTGRTPAGLPIEGLNRDALQAAVEYAVTNHRALLDSRNGRRALLLLAAMVHGQTWSEGPFARGTFRDLDRLAPRIAERVPVLDDYLIAQINALLRDDRYGVVGLSITMSQQLVPGLKIVRHIRRSYPGVKTVIGGACLSTIGLELPARLLEFVPDLEALIVRDGELALLRFVEASLAGGDLREVPNLVWRDGRTVRQNPCRSPMPVDALPMPAWTEDYLAAFPLNCPLPVLVGKGCYWGCCTFCTYPGHFTPEGGHPYSVRDPQRFVDELAALHARFGRDRFLFITDALPPPFAAEGSRRIREARRCGRLPESLRWWAYTKVDHRYTPELLHQMAAAGCCEVTMGAETLDNRLLRQIRKGCTAQMVDPQVRAAHEAGMRVKMDFIWDLPTTTAEEARRTLAGCQRLEPYLDLLAFNQLSIEAGSPMALAPEQHFLRVVSQEEYDQYWQERGRRPGAATDHITAIPTRGLTATEYRALHREVEQYQRRLQNRLVERVRSLFVQSEAERQSLQFRLNRHLSTREVAIDTPDGRQPFWLTVAMAIEDVEETPFLRLDVFTSTLPIVSTLLALDASTPWRRYRELLDTIHSLRPSTSEEIHSLILRLIENRILVAVRDARLPSPRPPEPRILFG